MKARDAKPQVGIFEIVDDILLLDTEDTQTSGRNIFTGANHMHSQDIKRLVKYDDRISDEIKLKFEANPAEYLNWPRGRVDYGPRTGCWTIMSSKDILSDERIVESLTRAFHLPPYLSGKIELVVDEGHYGY